MTHKCIIMARGSGFPYGIGASREKTLLMGKLFTSIGYDTYVLSEIYFTTQNASDIQARGQYQGIHYFLPHVMSPHTSRLHKVLAYIVTLLKSIHYISNLRHHYSSVTLLYDYQSLTTKLLLLKLVSLILHIPLIIHAEEWPLIKSDKISRSKHIRNYIFCKIAPRMSHGAIFISEYIKYQLQQINPALKLMKLPIMADFSLIERLPVNSSMSMNNQVKFVYTAHIGYREVIEFILAGFKELLHQNPLKMLNLVIVLHGPEEEINKLQDHYRSHKSIFILSSLSYNDLIQHLKSAHALLIPLRSTDQDAARFPHKIAEYLATQKAIITNWHGEIKHYFVDGKNALIMHDFTIEALVEKMRFVIDHPLETAQIGVLGYELGKREFDYYVHAEPLSQFMTSIDNR